MTAKEKAVKLVDKYYSLQHNTIICSEGYAKQCALIFVDEIINTMTPYISLHWWQEVKEEIMKL